MAAPKKMKMAKAYSFYVPADGSEVHLHVGDIVEGAMLAKVREAHKDFLTFIDDEIEEVEDEGRVKDQKLTEPEKPAKVKDEDPKDPDKQKKL